MGMSASQARLLSLQARMSDVEYEGQQINQQRLVLSNKMNEVMEKMTNMDVPTPPSKQDFLYNTYSGKTRNGKKISATMNDDGTFNFTKDVTGHIVEDGGLENITNGAEIKGARVSDSEYITGKEGQFHDVKDGETPNAHRATTPTAKDDLTEYKKENYHCVYEDSADKATGWKTFGPSTEVYKDRGAIGDCYASENSTSEIKVPKYKSKLEKAGGLYDSQGNYFGDQNAPTLIKEGYKDKETYISKSEYASLMADAAAYEKASDEDKESMTPPKYSTSELNSMQYKYQYQ